MWKAIAVAASACCCSFRAAASAKALFCLRLRRQNQRRNERKASTAIPPIDPPTMAPIGVEDFACGLVVGVCERLLLTVVVEDVWALFGVMPGGSRTPVTLRVYEGCWVS